jgi:hypothetical protein
VTDIDYSREFRMPDSYYEEPPWPDEEPVYAWHQEPARDPEECPECDGAGEFPVAQNEFGVWDTETCNACHGTGLVDE